MPLFLFIFHIFITYIHSFIQSHSYNSFAGASPYLLIAWKLSGKKPLCGAEPRIELRPLEWPLKLKFLGDMNPMGSSNSKRGRSGTGHRYRSANCSKLLLTLQSSSTFGLGFPFVTFFLRKREKKVSRKIFSIFTKYLASILTLFFYKIYAGIVIHCNYIWYSQK